MTGDLMIGNLKAGNFKAGNFKAGNFKAGNFKAIALRMLLSILILLTGVGAAGAGPSIDRDSVVRGLVQSQQGKPVDGAQVRAFELLQDGSTELLAASRSAANGRFSLPEARQGTLIEVATSAGRRLRWVPNDPASEPEELLFVVGLSDQVPAEPPAAKVGTTLEGRVVDPRGRPVPGATIQLIHYDFATMNAAPFTFLDMDGKERTEMTVDTDGRFEIRVDHRIDLPSIDLAAFGIGCSAPGWARGAVPVQRQERQTVSCPLSQPRTRAVGNAQGAPGGPHAPIPVTVMANTRHAPVFLTALSDERGSFSTPEELPLAENYLAVVNVPEYRPAAVGATSGNQTDLELPLLRGDDSLLVLEDRITGTPIAAAEAWVTLAVGEIRLKRRAEITAEGLLFRNLPPDHEVDLTVLAEGYLPYDDRRRLAARETLPLIPAATLRVEVQDRSGRPVPGADIWMTRGPKAVPPSAGASVKIRLAAFTGDHGQATIDHLLPRQPYSLTCEAPGYAPFWIEHWVPEPGVQKKTLVLDRGAKISGSLLHEDGTPFPGIQIYALRVTPDEDNPKLLHTTPAAQKDTFSDERGFYALPNLAAGNYRLKMIFPEEPIGPIRDFPRVPPIALAEGDLLSDFSFFFRSVGSLRLELADSEDPEALAEATISLHYDPQDTGEFTGARYVRRPAHEAGEAAAVLAGIAEATYDIEVRLPGHVPQRFPEVQISGGLATTLELEELDPGRAAEVTVVGDDQEPIPGTAVAFYEVTSYDTEKDTGGPVPGVPSESPSRVDVVTDEEGRAAFSGLRAGKYQIYVEDDRGRIAVEDLDIRESSPSLLRRKVLLTSGFRIPVRIEAVSGDPLPGVSVLLRRELPHFSGITYSGIADARGETTLEAVPPGQYLATLHVGSGAALDEELVSEPVYSFPLRVDDGRPLLLRMP